MIGVIGPLVQGKRQLRGSVRSVTVFALGAVAGAATTGVLIGALGSAVQALAGERVLAVVVGAAGVLLLLAGLGGLGFRTPALPPPTPPTWYPERGGPSAGGPW